MVKINEDNYQHVIKVHTKKISRMLYCEPDVDEHINNIPGIHLAQIFQGDSLSRMSFVLSMIPLTHVLQKTKAGYNLGNGSGTVNNFFMDDLKLYGNNENQVDSLVQTVRIFTEDIQMKSGISKCATLMMK